MALRDKPRLRDLLFAIFIASGVFVFLMPVFCIERKDPVTGRYETHSCHNIAGMTFASEPNVGFLALLCVLVGVAAWRAFSYRRKRAESQPR